jgi:hypothetical protein
VEGLSEAVRQTWTLESWFLWDFTSREGPGRGGWCGRIGLLSRRVGRRRKEREGGREGGGKRERTNRTAERDRELKGKERKGEERKGKGAGAHTDG